MYVHFKKCISIMQHLCDGCTLAKLTPIHCIARTENVNVTHYRRHVQILIACIDNTFHLVHEKLQARDIHQQMNTG